MKDSNNATEALRRLPGAMLDEDATIRNRGEAYDNLHDHVLDACRHAGVHIPTPAAAKLTGWTVEGTLHFAGGFNYTIDATDRADAERKARAIINSEADNDGRPPYEWGVELQEICIQNAVKDAS